VKFQPDQLDGVNAISRLEAGRIWVHAMPFSHSVLVPWRGDVQPWPAERLEDLDTACFDLAAQWQPEVVIFGSGPTHRFVSPALYRGLIAQRIGVETMDTAAACRTYNVLVNEGRKVVGTFIVAQAASTP